MEIKNSWICEQEKTIITSPVIEIIERKCKSSEDDRQLTFYLLRARDWCNIVPITEDGKIVMVKQYRIGISDHTLEAPGGVTDPADQDAQSAALREMEEETGYTLLPGGKCKYLGWTFPNPAMQDNRSHSYVVGPVKRTARQNLDAGEMIEVVEVPISEIPDRIRAGEISHALILNSFFFLSLETQEGSSGLLRRLNDFTRT
jgi:ADP-ribose pyrophosphatase